MEKNINPMEKSWKKIRKHMKCPNRIGTDLRMPLSANGGERPLGSPIMTWEVLDGKIIEIWMYEIPEFPMVEYQR